MDREHARERVGRFRPHTLGLLCVSRDLELFQVGSTDRILAIEFINFL
jgi:hypothetical protein